MLTLGQTLASGLKISKKKFHFDVDLCLQELINCTYVSGAVFAKLRLKDGGSFVVLSRRGEVVNHSVKWDQESKFSCKMYATNTGELEPCICKVSLRKETKGGRTYKKLGYVKINLAEYAGAGVMQRKYLLESYNEHKQKTDNSILKVRIQLRLTSGDSLFKAPKAKIWEIGEVEDEGIQADLRSQQQNLISGNTRMSTASTISAFSMGSSSCNSLRQGGGGGGGGGGSMQDMTGQRPSSISYDPVSYSAGNLRRPSVDKEDVDECTLSGLIRGGPCANGDARGVRRELLPLASSVVGKGGGTSMATSPSPVEGKKDVVSLLQLDRVKHHHHHHHQPQQLSNGGTTIHVNGGGGPMGEEPRGQCHDRSSSFGAESVSSNSSNSATSASSSREHPVVSTMTTATIVHSTQSLHRHQGSLSILNFGGGGGGGGASPNSKKPIRGHKRYNSASISWKSSGPSAACGGFDFRDTESITSSKSKLSMMSSTSRVEQTRVDPTSLIEQLVQSHDLTRKEGDEEEEDSHLQMYMDERGSITVAGPDWDKKYKHLKPIEKLAAQKSAYKSKTLPLSNGHHLKAAVS